MRQTVLLGGAAELAAVRVVVGALKSSHCRHSGQGDPPYIIAPPQPPSRVGASSAASPDGAGSAIPAATGVPKMGKPSALQVNRWARRAPGAASGAGRRKRRISAAARERIAAVEKKRRAAFRNEREQAEEPKPPAAKPATKVKAKKAAIRKPVPRPAAKKAVARKAAAKKAVKAKPAEVAAPAPAQEQAATA